MYKVHLLPALFGDSILIEYGAKNAPRYILIDGGPYYGFEKWKDALAKAAPGLKELELLIITHVDIDHIDGTITLLNQRKQLFKIKEIWFNGWKQLKPLKTDMLGALHGEYLTALIKKRKITQNKFFKGKAVMVSDPEKLPVISLPGGMKLTLLGPHKEALMDLKDIWKTEIDKITAKETIQERWERDNRYPDELGGAPPHPDNSVANRSSIAFIATCNKTSCLFAGDSPSAELLTSIRPLCRKQKTKKLKLNAWKLAHHGSRKSTMPEIMAEIDAPKILISTNGDRYRHPDKDCLLALFKNSKKGLRLFFNYRSEFNKVWANAAKKKKYGYTATYPETGDGISITLQS